MKRVACDFDGVICRRLGIPRSGSFIECVPNKDAVDAIKHLFEMGFEPYVCTNRIERADIEGWLIKYQFPKMIVTNKKLPNTILYIDDRAVRFTNWQDIVKYLV